MCQGIFFSSTSPLDFSESMKTCLRSFSFRSSALTPATAGFCFVLSVGLREPGTFLSVLLPWLKTSADPVFLQPRHDLSALLPFLPSHQLPLEGLEWGFSQFSCPACRLQHP